MFFAVVKRTGIFSRRLNDILWNLISLVMIGASGILINVLIGLGFGVAVLGQFNLLFASYVVFSQFGAFGIHLSALKHVAEWSHDARVLASVVMAGLASVGLTSLVAATIFAVSASLQERLFESPNLSASIVLAAPGLALFSINKYNISVLNGLSRLRVLAAVQMLRAAGLVICVAIAAWIQCPEAYLGAVFTFSEGIVCIASLPFTIAKCRGVSKRDFWLWVKKHFLFGAFSFPGHLLIDLGSRVDVLVLGIFVNDRLIGIYSFAATLAEGVAQVPQVFRTVLNGDVVRSFVSNDRRALLELMRRNGPPVMILTGLISAIIITTYPIVISNLNLDLDLLAGWQVLLIILIGVVIASPLAPFSFALLQAGRPFMHTIAIGGVLLANVVLAVLLIPAIGPNGAAAATAFMVVAMPVTVMLLVYKVALPRKARQGHL